MTYDKITKYENNLLMLVSLLFSQLDLIWPKLCPRTTPTLLLLLISNEMCWGIQLIFTLIALVVLKKMW